MKSLKNFLAASLIAVSLAGCSTSQVGDFIGGGIVNPITNVDIYRVKNVYAATLELANRYRSYCYEVSYQQILADPIRRPVCKDRRAVIRQIQRYQPIAGEAVRKADAFVRSNPTVNASGVIGVAWDAVSQFQRVVPTINR
jgi:hypothetical protein